MMSLKILLAYWILLFFVFRCIVPSLGVSCKGFGHHNPPDDWFVLYKLPRKINDENRLVQKGNAFIYITSKQQKWAFSEIGIDDKFTPIYNTLQQIYDRPNNSGLDFVMYNDQPPNTERVATIAGQTKGAFAFDELGGFWMITSTPRFPMPFNSKYTYVFPERYLESSQIIICISLDKDQKQTLKNSIFPITMPYNYSGAWDIPERNPPSSDIMMENVGTGYIYFAKHRRIEKDVFEFARRRLSRKEMTVHTTPRTSAELKNNHMRQVRLLMFMLPLPNPHVLQWMSSSDSSKWAVTKDFICIGDLNRNEQQLSRGGGLLCMRNPEVAAQFESLVACSSVLNEDVSYVGYMVEAVADMFFCCFWSHNYYEDRVFCLIITTTIVISFSVIILKRQRQASKNKNEKTENLTPEPETNSQINEQNKNPEAQQKQ